MRFQSVKAFEKHLSEAGPANLSHVYLVAAPVDYEREKIIEKIVAALHVKDPCMHVFVFEAATIPIEVVADQLNTRALFGDCSIVVLGNIEKLKKASAEVLARYLTNPSPNAYLILGAASLKGHADLYQKAKRELVICDLTEEKPWERQRRLKEWLIEKAAKDGKTLQPDAAQHLFDHVGWDMPCLEQELEKLICYTGERRMIELKDVTAVCQVRLPVTGWQLAEAVVWGEGKASSESIRDLAALLPLIGQVRYLLDVGLQIVGGVTPPIKETSLEKYSTAARRRPPHFFERGLLALFDLEFACKSSSADPALLWDLFTSKMRHYALSPSESSK